MVRRCLFSEGGGGEKPAIKVVLELHLSNGSSRFNTGEGEAVQ